MLSRVTSIVVYLPSGLFDESALPQLVAGDFDTARLGCSGSRPPHTSVADTHQGYNHQVGRIISRLQSMYENVSPRNELIANYFEGLAHLPTPLQSILYWNCSRCSPRKWSRCDLDRTGVPRSVQSVSRFASLCTRLDSSVTGADLHLSEPRKENFEFQIIAMLQDSNQSILQTLVDSLHHHQNDGRVVCQVSITI